MFDRARCRGVRLPARQESSVARRCVHGVSPPTAKLRPGRSLQVQRQSRAARRRRHGSVLHQHRGGRMTAKLVGDVIDSIRSKNAGPFAITIDLFFPDASTFETAKEKDIFDKATIAQLYKMDVDDVDVFYFRPCLAVKISFPRDMPCGTPGDRDMLGGQQFTPILSIPFAEGP